MRSPGEEPAWRLDAVPDRQRTPLSGVWNQIRGPSPATAVPALVADRSGHLLKGLGWKDRPHLSVAGLVPANPGMAQTFRKEASRSE